MSSRDRLSPLRLPSRVIIVLIICGCSLAVHFIVERLAPVDGQMVLQLTAHGGYMHHHHEDSEDHFVLPSLGPLHIERFLTCPAYLEPPYSLSALVSPILPPPNS